MSEEKGEHERIGPGSWINSFFGEASSTLEHLGDRDKETALRVLADAQERIFRFTVVIITSGLEEDSDLSESAPGTGVLVRLKDGSHGILTAAHVLSRRNSTKHSSAVTLLIPPKARSERKDIAAMELESRQCTIVGFDNDSDAGPDIAIIPVRNGELRALDDSGMVAYNLSKQRWPEEDREVTAGKSWWVVSIIHGARFEASRILTDHAEEGGGHLAIVTTNTHVAASREESGYDYLDLLSTKTERSWPMHWTKTPPGRAAEEIEHLNEEGVTRRVWGGTSGAGVWNLIVEADEAGIPSGRVLVELGGICFYAHQAKESIIAHGPKSIEKIAALHVEAEALRYHGTQ